MRLVAWVLITSFVSLGAENAESEIGVEIPSIDRPSVGLDVHYAPITYLNYELSSGNAMDRSGHALGLSLEWLPLQRYGKMGLGLQTGFFVIANQTAAIDSLATVYTLPAIANLSYHFDYLEDQIVAPFARVGLGITWVKQQSSTGAAIDGIHSYRGWEYTFGAQLCLNAIDRHGAKSIRRNLGVNSTYLVFAFTRNQPLLIERKPDLSYEVYQLGFRVEI